MLLFASPKVRMQGSEAASATIEGADVREQQVKNPSGADHALEDEQLDAVVAGVGIQALSGEGTLMRAGRRPIIW